MSNGTVLLQINNWIIGIFAIYMGYQANDWAFIAFVFVLVGLANLYWSTLDE